MDGLSGVRRLEGPVDGARDHRSYGVLRRRENRPGVIGLSSPADVRLLDTWVGPSPGQCTESLVEIRGG